MQQLVPAAEGRDGTSDDAAATATPPALGGLRGIALLALMAFTLGGFQSVVLEPGIQKYNQPSIDSGFNF